jgi:hypothetical protein
VTRDRYHHLVAAQFCAIHTASGRPDMCEMGRRTADELREITDDAAHAGR